jgi:hypothetical protein
VLAGKVEPCPQSRALLLGNGAKIVKKLVIIACLTPWSNAALAQEQWSLLTKEQGTYTCGMGSSKFTPDHLFKFLGEHSFRPSRQDNDPLAIVTWIEPDGADKGLMFVKTTECGDFAIFMNGRH